MEKILDIEERTFENKGNSYAEQSFNYLMYILGLIALSLLLSIPLLFSRLGLLILASIIILGTFIILVIILILNLFGIIRGIQSFAKNERNTFKKYVGLIGNLLIGFLIALYILSIIFDNL